MNRKCFLCKSSEDNELLFGKFYSKYKLSVHYYCLLLSSNLVQRGSNDTVGIFGFLEADIRKENERTKKCRCYICKEMHANVSCCSKKCLRTFHTVCGIMNGCLSHYTDTYQSWCSAHVPLEPERSPHLREEPCSICYDEMGQYDVITSIKAPCCRNGWFHQNCLTKYAQSAGYFFKCPLCKNEDKFLAEIPLRGVFVPERDAAWELEPNAFQEQLLRPTACDANDCKCPEGRSIDNRQWRLVVCGSCGSTCRHRQCMEQTEDHSRVYLCQLCQPIMRDCVPELENTGDSSDSSDDDTASTSTLPSVGRTPQGVARKTFSRTGSGESGVHCSSSDETLGNIRRLVIARRISSDDSDSERSDASSIQIRRCIRQNTGKRVRRLISEGSDNAQSNHTKPAHISSSSEDLPLAQACKRLDFDSNSTGTHPLCLERSSSVSEMDENSSSKDNVRSTRQRSRRLSTLSNSSKQSTSEIKLEAQVPDSLVTRRPIIYSSSDDSSKRSESGKRNLQVIDELPELKELHSARQLDKKPSSSAQCRRPRLSSSSDDSEKCSENVKNRSPVSNSSLISTKRDGTLQGSNRSDLPTTERTDPSTSCSRGTEAIKKTKTSPEANSSCKQEETSAVPVQSNIFSNSTSSKRFEENFNITDTVHPGNSRSPPASKKGENSNASDTSSEDFIAIRRTRQLTRRLSLTDARTRSTSESSMEIVRPKRIRAVRISTISDSSDKRSEDSESGSTDKVDTAPQSKRRRLVRERGNKANPNATTLRRKPPSPISPPSTPSSLASESSQPATVASICNTSKTDVVDDAKDTSGVKLYRSQQSMLQFVTTSSRKSATTSDSSDLSMEEPVTTSRRSNFGSCNNINDNKSSPITSKCTTASTKRRRSHSPKRSNNRSHNGQQSETAATSSRASSQQRKQNGQFMRKDKGQKNILNYFNRC